MEDSLASLLHPKVRASPIRAVSVAGISGFTLATVGSMVGLPYRKIAIPVVSAVDGSVRGRDGPSNAESLRICLNSSEKAGALAGIGWVIKHPGERKALIPVFLYTNMSRAAVHASGRATLRVWGTLLGWTCIGTFLGIS